MKDTEKYRRKIDRIDRRLASFFAKRMAQAAKIGEIKRKSGEPIRDIDRENRILRYRASFVSPALKPYYLDWLRQTMRLSREYQASLRSDFSGAVRVSVFPEPYPVYIGNGLLSRASELFALDRKVFILTDDGVPAEYAERLAAQCRTPIVTTLPQGEEHKNAEGYLAVLEAMSKAEIGRGDCVVSLGGGVVGDMAGFAAATYMRGIDFYQIPTTLLAQADASVGGKTAIDFAGKKNQIGAFKQPKAVLADVSLLSTLPARQMANGFAEIIKMALTLDAAFFAFLEENTLESLQNRMPEVITRAVQLKARIVEEDEKEADLRRVLNFGHTLGHAIESSCEGKLYHGECVGIGLLHRVSEDLRPRVEKVLTQYALPITADFDLRTALDVLRHDKKTVGEGVLEITVDQIGEWREEKMTFDAFAADLRKINEENKGGTV